jgi:hypothetical protein
MAQHGLLAKTLKVSVDHTRTVQVAKTIGWGGGLGELSGGAATLFFSRDSRGTSPNDM